jgi:shikimate kinase
MSGDLNRMPAHVVFVGLMGAGKTTVGRLLASALAWPLSDSDEVITARCGATVRELNERLGTDGMHRLEAEHLMDAVAAPGNSVICAAASVVEVPGCRQALRAPDLFTVWLETTAAILASRFASAPHRPALGDDPAVVLEQQLARRAAGFAELEPYRIVVDTREPAEITDQLLHVLETGEWRHRSPTSGL